LKYNFYIGYVRERKKKRKSVPDSFGFQKTKFGVAGAINE